MRINYYRFPEGMEIADNIKCKEFTFDCRPIGSRLKGMENTWEYAIYFRGKQVGTARTKKEAQKWVGMKVRAVNAVLEAARKKHGDEKHGKEVYPYHQPERRHQLFTPSFTISQDGQTLKTFSDTEKERAVSAAKAFAATTDKDVIITAHLDAETDRDVIFHPDGTNEKIWIIDMGQCMKPVVGQVYTNRGGGRFRCIAPADVGPTFYNAAGGSSNTSGVFQNIKSGWTFTAKGIIQYIDGTIEWDHSVGGHFEDVTT